MSGFKDVVGHSEIIQYIQNAVTEDKVSHAYILNGEKWLISHTDCSDYTYVIAVTDQESDKDSRLSAFL